MRTVHYAFLVGCGLWLGLAACSDDLPGPRKDYRDPDDCSGYHDPGTSDADDSSGTAARRSRIRGAGAPGTMNASVYQFAPLSIHGSPVPLSQYRGRKLLIVNVASRCGYTPQYADLQQLYQQYGQRVVVLGFPCNQFGGQEPDGDTTIYQFCTGTYNVTFPMFHKIDVKGPNADPLYKFLADRARNGRVRTAPTWNFAKYLVDENGFVERYFPSATNPLDTAVVNAILR